MTHTIGVLSFHGDVLEHIEATRCAGKKLGVSLNVIPVRSKTELANCTSLIIPGGESTTLHKLCVREGMWEDMKTLPFIFGTCAGAIMIADTVLHKAEAQETLGRMHITIDRNAYGRQTDSFEEPLETTLGKISAVYIRAPKIMKIDPTVRILAKKGEEILACEETHDGSYSLAACFHPELTSTIFHEYFIQKVLDL
jgi:5'-phosphate synthase pdxT subunit